MSGRVGFTRPSEGDRRAKRRRFASRRKPVRQGRKKGYRSTPEQEEAFKRG